MFLWSIKLMFLSFLINAVTRMKQLSFRIITKGDRRVYIRTGYRVSYLISERFHIFSASLWNCRLKIPRDARVNAFFAPTIKSNENRWVTQGAVRSRYVFDTYPKNINGISEGMKENWSSLLKITVQCHIMTTPLRYQ